jgi:hypothetical protein
MHYMDFDRDLIQEHHQHMHGEVSSLRLQKRLRDDRDRRRSRFIALARRSALPLLRGAGLTG